MAIECFGASDWIRFFEEEGAQPGGAVRQIIREQILEDKVPKGEKDFQKGRRQKEGD